MSHHIVEEERRKYFLAYVNHQLSVQCCRMLAQITARTGKSFLTVARRGRSPLRQTVEGDSGNDPGKHDEFDMHEAAYRSVRSAIAASCALGHRSCHTLWGPRGCGEHRILRLVAQDCMQRNQTLVLYLDGDTLNSDDDALRTIAQQILRFLKSSQSAELRAADWSLRTGTFDFGHLFGFEKLLEQNGESSDDADQDSTSVEKSSRVATNRQRRSSKGAQVDGHRRAKKRSRVQSSDESEGSDDDDGMIFVTSTTAYASGGVSSALPALQRSLLLMKSYGTNLVVCIRRVERFGVWCDQLLYVLSGLMHESDGQGGGMSLVMTSSTPDIRQLEKRLSSRLTCETRCIPLLPWSVGRVVRACLVEVKDCLQRQLGKKVAPKGKYTRGKKTQNEISSVTPMQQVRHFFMGWRFDDSSVADRKEEQVLKRNVVAKSRSNHEQLLEQSMVEMATAVIAELDIAAVANVTQGSLAERVFAWRIAHVSGQLRSIGATAGRVMTAAAAAFGEVCSGRLAFLTDAGCNSILLWIARRLKKGEWESCCELIFSGVPISLQAKWLSIQSAEFSDDVLVEEKTKTTTTTKTTVKSSFSSQHLLFDALLSDCQFVSLGYCSREMFLVLVYVYLRHEAGVSRTVVDLLEDVASSMGTQAAAALDRAAFLAAVAALNRWRVIRVGGRDDTGVVSLCGSPARLREFLWEVLQRNDCCSTILGLEVREITRLRSLI